MLQVTLLGEQAIVDDSTGDIRARSSRGVALIAFLICHAGAPQTRQRIAQLFWRDSTDPQALTNLRRELHHLRQVLGDQPSLEVTSTHLRWVDSDSSRVDIRRFVLEREASLAAAAVDDVDGILLHGTAAIAQYAGEFLPGGYEDWVLSARSEFERQCVDLCILVCQTHIRRGDLAAAASVARRRIALEPLEEDGYRVLMEIQADLGDRAGAVSTYHRCASVLERELGVDPDEATRQTLQRLLAYVEREDVPRATPEASAGRLGRATVPLVGRNREVAALQELWRSAAAGRSCLALVHGSPGVGKTRLVADVADLARAQGAVVATAQCFGTSGRLALAPVADWLRSPAVQSSTATLDPVWRAEVERLTPSGTGGLPRGAGARAMADAWQRHRFFEGLARAFMGIGRPLLLVLDNVQWCDQETLAFLTFYLGLAVGTPVMVAATRRDEELGTSGELADWTVRMRASGMLTEIALDPLEGVATRQLAAAISGRTLSEAEIELLQATTGGFPLYVIEAARATAAFEDAPQPSVDRTGDLTGVLRNRLDQATPTARQIAGLAAAVGRNFTLDLLSEASDLEADVVVRAVDELWRHRILHELADGYDFSHDLLRETAYAQVSPPQRWLLHRRLAQGLELLHAGNIDLVAAQLAEQYARGGRPDRAIAYFQQAADVASRVFAYQEAIRLYKEALRIVEAQPPARDRDWQELRVLEAMAAPLTARSGYASPELQRVLEKSITLADQLGRRESTISGLFGLWGSRYVQGRTSEARDVAARALELVPLGSELSGSAHFAVAGAILSLGRPAEAIEHFNLSAKLKPAAHSWTIGTRPDVHGLAWSAHAHWLVGDIEGARSSASEAVELARAIDHPYSLAVALAYAGVTHQLNRDVPALHTAVNELRELCERFSFAYYRDWVLILEGWTLPEGAGLNTVRRGVHNLRAEGSFARMPYWLALLAELYAIRDQPAAVRATLDAALVAAQTRNDLWWLPEVMRLRAGCDEGPDGVARLVSAAQLATSQGSVALLARIEADLSARGVRLGSDGVPS